MTSTCPGTHLARCASFCASSGPSVMDWDRSLSASRYFLPCCVVCHFGMSYCDACVVRLERKGGRGQETHVRIKARAPYPQVRPVALVVVLLVLRLQLNGLAQELHCLVQLPVVMSCRWGVYAVVSWRSKQSTDRRARHTIF